MKTLKDLTPEISAKIPEYKAIVRQFYDGGFELDEKVTTEYIEYVYELAGKEKPVVIFTKNPDDFKMKWEILQSNDKLLELVEEGYNLKNKIGKAKRSLDDIQKDIYSVLNKKLSKKETAKLQKECEKSKVRAHYLFLCDIYTRCYLSWYRFISKEFDIEHKTKDTLEKLYQMNMKSSIGKCYFTNGYVLVLPLPDKVKFNERHQLHNSEGPAISYPGYEMYYWKGAKVPKKLIMTPDAINKADVEEYSANIEARRAFIEVLGARKYFNILSDGTELTILDTDTDNQGNQMELLTFDFSGTKIQVLEVVCPSTGRIYNIYPPNQNSKNVWDAKASTFNTKADKFKPVIET